MQRALRFLCLCLVVGCGGFAGAAPDPKTCRVDSDCQPGPLVNPNNVCCDTGMHLNVFGRDYLVWRAEQVRKHCARVKCPILPSPNKPLPCSLQGRCASGKCRTRCGEASQDPLPPSFSAMIRRPDARERWVHFEAKRTAKGDWQLVGCETAARIHACRATRERIIPAAAAAELAPLWTAARAGNFLCRIRISMADWLPFTIDWAGGKLENRMPRTRIRELPRCFPQANLAWWLLERWGS
jgi:hypothetical protein